MKFYQNINTNEIIGVDNMRQVISHPTEQSMRAGFVNYSYEVVYDMICPNKILGEGITSFCITNSFLTKNYKRIKREIALNRYPNFNQYRHKQLCDEASISGIEKLDIIRKQTF